jgi:hypothetical protein
MLRLGHITATTLLLLGLSANLSAEEVNLPTLETEVTETEVTESAIPNETPTQASEFSVQLPGRGMSMEMVQNRFGEPLEKEPAVGEPPISKWTFNNSTVYFESEFVIHAVVNN